MVSAYPGLFYPGQVYPAQLDGVTPPPPDNPPPTVWPSWVLTRDGRWIRRQTRTLVWGSTGLGYDLYDGASGTDIYDASTGSNVYDMQWPLATSVPLYDGNGSTDILDGGGTVAAIFDGNG